MQGGSGIVQTPSKGDSTTFFAVEFKEGLVGFVEEIIVCTELRPCMASKNPVCHVAARVSVSKPRTTLLVFEATPGGQLTEKQNCKETLFN